MKHTRKNNGRRKRDGANYMAGCRCGDCSPRSLCAECESDLARRSFRQGGPVPKRFRDRSPVR